VTGKDGAPVALRPKQFLPAAVDPGETLDAVLSYRLPKVPLPPGNYRLTLSLWHGQKDSLTALGLANDLVLDVTLPTLP